ncbi:BPG_G0031730.mRNA.1.CDS.1 [Saccharomyces cerevisiae]|nr:BPG_G0031730.mRNA.1.CDS.1 [Saccharomyces cerevisiae]CAI7198256.1 BPG_G0031730.mRNA.1.CDS.1 [Saccharomyces cerevisiae]
MHPNKVLFLVSALLFERAAGCESNEGIERRLGKWMGRMERWMGKWMEGRMGYWIERWIKRWLKRWINI